MCLGVGGLFEPPIYCTDVADMINGDTTPLDGCCTGRVIGSRSVANQESLFVQTLRYS